MYFRPVKGVCICLGRAMLLCLNNFRKFSIEKQLIIQQILNLLNRMMDIGSVYFQDCGGCFRREKISQLPYKLNGYWVP